MEQQKDTKNELKGFDRSGISNPRDPIFRVTKDELEKIQDKIPCIIEGILPENCLIGFAGLPGSWKTWSAIHIALCATSGEQFLNRYPVTKRGAVLYIDADRASSVMRLRLNLLVNTSQLLKGEYKQLGIFPAMGKHINIDDRSFGKMASEDMVRKSLGNEFINTIKKICEEENVVLIIIDTYRDTFLGNENESKDTQMYLNALDKIRAETHSSVILIHHVPKQDSIDYSNVYSVLRGSTALAGKLDLCYSFELIHEDGDEAIVAMHTSKNNIFEKAQTITIKFDKTNRPFTITSEVFAERLTERQKKAREEIIERLKSAGKPLGFTELTSGEKKTAREKQLEKMVQKGLVKKDEDGKYTLP